MFRRTGQRWTQDDELTAFDGAADDRFGYSVGLLGTRQPWCAAQPLRGRTRLHRERSGTNWKGCEEAWPDEEKPGDGFGFSIAGSTHAAVIGSDGWDSDTGAAWDFRAPPGNCVGP